MKYLTTNQIRNLWLNFFKEHDHFILPSASLIPVNDKSLLWINSGVATLKPYFEGKITPPSLRITNLQKSLRTNDIENVGYTARHLTFFEMMGNFSIGDYFKRDAIQMAWEFLTSDKWIGFDPEKLYITIYEKDTVTLDLWKKITRLDEKHFILGNKELNFWDMGRGPCGPNTEIYFDRGSKYDPNNVGIKLLKEDLPNERYLELWNIVFSEFNNLGNDKYSELPQKNIDTGAGLERFAVVLQNKTNVFETDLFEPIIEKISKFTNLKYTVGLIEEPEDIKKINVAFRVIADHIRTSSFAIADGVFPGNKERSYVVRRLIRRAMVFAHYLKIKNAFLYKLVPIVVDIMGDFYHNIVEKKEIIIQTIKTEEEQFIKTLKVGRNILINLINKRKNISAKVVFFLFETYGFPIEMTVEVLKQNNIEINKEELGSLIAKQQELSRISQETTNAMEIQKQNLAIGKFESRFVGYNYSQVNNAKIIYLANASGPCQSLTNEQGFIVLDRTPFYAEKGGQANDTGVIELLSGNGIADVIDVQTGKNNEHIHKVNVKGTIKIDSLVNAKIDSIKRYYVRKNHSGTHLIHAALRHVLSNQVMQSGSFNNDAYLRLDFTYNKKLNLNDVVAAEQQVLHWIKTNYITEIINCSYKQAIDMNALAFFKDRYDIKNVRVIKFGDFSLELCGGTHVNNTKEIETFLITKFESKGAGVWRIHALTSYKTVNAFLTNEFEKIKAKSDNLRSVYKITEKYLKNTEIENLFKKIESNDITDNISWRQVNNDIAQLEQKMKTYNAELKQITANQIIKKYFDDKPTIVNDIEFFIYSYQDINSTKMLSELSDHFLSSKKDAISILINNTGDKTTIITNVSSQLKQKYSAKILLKKIFETWDGRGGGSDSLAQGVLKSTLIVNDSIRLKIIEIFLDLGESIA